MKKRRILINIARSWKNHARTHTQHHIQECTKQNDLDIMALFSIFFPNFASLLFFNCRQTTTNLSIDQSTSEELLYVDRSPALYVCVRVQSKMVSCSEPAYRRWSSNVNDQAHVREFIVSLDPVEVLRPNRHIHVVLFFLSFLFYFIFFFIFVCEKVAADSNQIRRPADQFAL